MSSDAPATPTAASAAAAAANDLSAVVNAGRSGKHKDRKNNASSHAGGDDDGYESDESIASVVDADININRTAHDRKRAHHRLPCSFACTHP